MRLTSGAVLESLKDFQRETVHHVYRRLYSDPKPARRFLIADEVGLGKTMVARGVAALGVEELERRGVERIDIVYICSNQDIARQNVNRLNFIGEENQSLASRITLMPRDLARLKGGDNDEKPRINFISITPGTSLDPKSRLGSADERAVLFALLRRLWGFRSDKSALKLLRGHAGLDGFASRAWTMHGTNLDEDLTASFGKALAARDSAAPSRGLRLRFENLCDEFRWHRATTRPSADLNERRSALVRELRAVLATSCVEALEPDIIVLDEFQRFRSLLDGADDASQLARELFNYEDEVGGHARVLLLSATPYKMYTLADDADGDEDHYGDFHRTLKFLFEDRRADEVTQTLKAYRQALCRPAMDGIDGLGATRDRLQGLLRQVMVRTERLAVTPDRNGMLRTVFPQGVELAAGDVRAFMGLSAAADVLGAPEVLEYWKSGPYLLNFMDSYRFKRRFKEASETDQLQDTLAEILRDHPEMLLDQRAIEAYAEIDPGNARMRGLVADMIEGESWRLLWLPPAMPYYEVDPPFARARDLTKRLVFSSWQVVPKVVAGLLSYLAEREMRLAFESDAKNTAEARAGFTQLLAFRRAQGRLAGMPVLGLLYPSFALAAALEPADLAAGGPVPTIAVARERACTIVSGLLEKLPSGPSQGPVDEAWYWAAPILLDQHSDAKTANAWLERSDLAAVWGQETEHAEESGGGGFAEHVDRAREMVRRERTLGRRPADLAKVIADLALGGLGVCALRTLGRPAAGADPKDPAVRDVAAQVAWAQRTLFNLPEVTSLLRSSQPRSAYWRQVLTYSIGGCIQAMLDEYAHVLADALFVHDKDSSGRAAEIAAGMTRAITLRTASFNIDSIAATDGGITSETEALRARFATRFGDERSIDNPEPTRADQVRAAFNSPFWPFVLATTSVGQEGLDFHSYCHAVVHWNLPSNPVDLEQREGRVHRYKGHAVRKNIASTYAGASSGGPENPWDELFDLACADRADDENELIPFWVFRGDGADPAVIERHVPALPFSRDVARFERLRSSLAAYRLAFGQPRQEDLVSFLVERYPPEEITELVERLKLDLGPLARK